MYILRRKNVDLNIKCQTITDAESLSKARLLIMKWGYQHVQSPDWIAQKDGEWIIFEIKEKDLFTPGSNFPHYGIGLDKSQIFLRKQVHEGLTLRTSLLCFIKGSDDVYFAYIDELEAKANYYDTPSKIRIYPLEHFEKLGGI